MVSLGFFDILQLQQAVISNSENWPTLMYNVLYTYYCSDCEHVSSIARTGLNLFFLGHRSVSDFTILLKNESLGWPNN